MKKFTSTLLLLFLVAFAFAQAPSGYYNAAKNKKGSSLKTALCGIIYSHTQLSYKALWNAYKTTDVRSDGKIWDMYSSATNYVPGGSAQGHSYSGEGDSYNREHSFPKSWFNDGSPMYTDLHHVIPTDGYVNNRRSNYPFGETDNPTYSSSGGFSKLGPSSVSGYTGTVFEPNDEYKGDFARIYFYMMTCYENQISGWKSDMLAKNKYPGLAEWALNMLMRWAKEDPVSQKEIDRNNAVYHLQNNRNPFVDFPKLEEYIWGSKTDQQFDPNNYDGGSGTGGGDSIVKPNAPVFTPAGGEVERGTTVTISSSTEGAYIYYNVNGGTPKFGASPVEIYINNACTITAYASANGLESDTVQATYTIKGDTTSGGGSNPDINITTFKKIDSNTDLVDGNYYILVSEKYNVAMGTANGSYRRSVAVNIDSENVIDIAAADDVVSVLKLQNVTGGYTFEVVGENAFLSLNSDKNALETTTQTAANNMVWTISISEGTAQIYNKAFDERLIQYNSGSPRFATYKTTSKQQTVQLYRQYGTETGLESIQPRTDVQPVIYDLQGRRVFQMQKGRIYIINGKKVLAK